MHPLKSKQIRIIIMNYFVLLDLIETLNLLKIKIFDKGCPCAAIKRFLNKNIDFKKEKKKYPRKKCFDRTN